MSPRSIRPILLLFFVSGATGLIYEVVWTRVIGLVFGITTYAITTVLCAYMGGLALGSFALGRLGDRVQRPLRLYGLLEIGIGAYALIFPSAMGWLENGVVYLHRQAAVESDGLTVARFLLCFAILLPPTFLMGGTLPLLSRYTQRYHSFSRSIGYLYGANTTGAVFGTLGAGFVMIANLGSIGTNLAAAVLSIVVGVVAILLGDSAGLDERSVSPADADIETYPILQRRLAFWAIGSAGICSLGIQVLWNRVLVLYVHNSTYAFSLLLAVFLVGLAIGSWIFGVIGPRLRRHMLWFAALEFALAVWTIISLYLIGKLGKVAGLVGRNVGWDDWHEVLATIGAQVAVVVLPGTILMGMALPLATRIWTPPKSSVASRVGGTYAINAVGTVIGALVTGFALIPLLGVRGAFLALVVVNLTLTALLVLGTREVRRFYRLAAVPALVLVAIAAFNFVPPGVVRNRFSQIYGELLFYKEEIEDTVMVADLNRGPEWRTLIFADGRGTAGHWTRIEDRFYGHLPLLLHENPKDVLVIAFGVGNTAGAIAQHSSVEAIHVAELSPGVVATAGYFHTNFNVLEDERVKMHAVDGRNFLLLTEEKYDVIHLDPPELHTANVVNLYTKEFYELCKRRLKPGGVMSHWFNSVKLAEPDLKAIVRTFLEVFPHATVWQGPMLYSWNLIAFDHPLSIPWTGVNKRIAEASVKASLAEDGMDDPQRFFSHLLMASESVAVYTAGASVITDDRTIIDFTNPRSRESDFGWLRLRERGQAPPSQPYETTLARFREPGREYLCRASERTDSVEALIRWDGMSPESVQHTRARIAEEIQRRQSFIAEVCR